MSVIKQLGILTAKRANIQPPQPAPQNPGMFSLENILKGLTAEVASGFGLGQFNKHYVNNYVAKMPSENVLTGKLEKRLLRYLRKFNPSVNYDPGFRAGYGVPSPGPHYDPVKNIIRMETSNDAATLAHEAGHAMQTGKGFDSFAKLPISFKLRMLGMGGGFGSLGAAVSRDERYGLGSGIAGSAMMAPTVANELDASLKGFKALTRAAPRMPLPNRLRTFVGLPTYAVAAAAPMATYGIKKLLGGYNKPTTSNIK